MSLSKFYLEDATVSCVKYMELLNRDKRRSINISLHWFLVCSFLYGNIKRLGDIWAWSGLVTREESWASGIKIFKKQMMVKYICPRGDTISFKTVNCTNILVKIVWNKGKLMPLLTKKCRNTKIYIWKIVSLQEIGDICPMHIAHKKTIQIGKKATKAGIF